MAVIENQIQKKNRWALNGKLHSRSILITLPKNKERKVKIGEKNN